MNRRHIIVACGLTMAAVVGLGGVEGWDRWTSRCSASFKAMSAEELAAYHAAPIDQADLGALGYVDRADTDRILADIGQGTPLLKPRGIAFTADGRERLPIADLKLFGAADGDVLLRDWLPGPQPETYRAVLVDGTDSRARWGRTQVGYAIGSTSVPGHTVLMGIPEGREPRLAAVDRASGELTWCAKLGNDSKVDPATEEQVLRSASDGHSVYVTHSSRQGRSNSADARLSRIDATSGAVSWDRAIPGLTSVGSVDVLGDQLLMAPTRGYEYESVQADWDYLHDRPAGVPITVVGGLIALSAETGKATWSYRGPDESGWINTVVDVHEDTAVVHARRPMKQYGEPKDQQSWLVALRKDGSERWRLDLGSDIPKLLVAGDVVIRDVEDRQGFSLATVAYSTTTGAVRWNIRGQDETDPPRPSLWAASVVGDTLLADSANARGIVSVDLSTGKARIAAAVDIDNPDGIVADESRVTISVSNIILGFDRQTP